jgi:4-hydroxy-3-methylbut-2-en-1-yl diphosphate reductase
MQVQVVDLSTVQGTKNSLCYGIARTFDLAEQKARTYHTDKPLYVYFHLPAGSSQQQREQTQATLQRRFGTMANEVRLVDKMQDVPDQAPFLIGTRGASPQVREEVRQRLDPVLDTTCPYVTSQEAAARKLLDEGYQLVFCGLREYHGMPRLQGIAKSFGKELYVAHRPEDVSAFPFKRSTRIGVILQTTWHMSLSRDVISQLVSEFREVKVIDTACIDSLGRVPAARKVAAENDVIVIVDIGKIARYLEEEIEEVARRSANCAAEGSAEDANPQRSSIPRVYRTEGKQDLRPEWFTGARKVAVIGGVNVHTQILEDVAARIRELAAV